VLEQRFGVYRVQPVGAVSFDPDNPRPAVIDPVNGRLRVAATNVLNYFTTFDTTPGSNNGPYICGPLLNQECRGANNAFEFARQRDKIINVILGLDADVIGLMEIENNPGASVQDLVDGLNAASAPGTYAFINTGTIGTDAIKVALLYRPAKVTPVGAYAILDSTVDPTFIDTLNRPVLAQTFEENLTGERFTVAVNHLKSKGSACSGDPDIGDGQGNCNLTRLNAAIAEANWLAGDPTNSGDPDFIIVGDMNSYAMEDPINALEGLGFTNLINAFAGPDAYSYVFSGQSGYLDHALATSTLNAQTMGATEWHVNADEPIALDYNEEFKTPNQVITFYSPEPFRASDHDPLVVGLDLVPQCNGLNATVYVDHNNKIVGGPFNGQTYHQALTGSSGADVIVGTEASDTIFGLGGNDVVCAGGGSDTVFGGNGDDTVFGNGGHDTIFGGIGNDTIDAGDGNDNVLGEAGNDALFGGADNDVLLGGIGMDNLDGGAGTDTLDGGLEADLVAGGSENDTVLGGPGNDALNGGSGSDLCNGGIGTDSGTACETSILIP
jgi:Ca2+-binding RTX toxin-like protein